MPRWLAGLIVYMTYLTSIGNTVNPACDCVVYQSYGGSHGQFTSPNFPKPYEKTNCILYTFIGDVGEIIELNFIQFDMKMPDYNRGCSDFLRLFLNLDRPQVNENNRHDEELCGNMSTIKKTYYSSGRSLILEFHADRDSNHTGFQGRFKFMDKAQFTTTGTKTPWAPCAYHFNHTDSPNAGGQFFSPSYPQNYPPSSECQYLFEAYAGERVKIIFENVQLHNSDVSCYDSPDVIIVYDGIDASSPVIGHYCGVQNQVELVSSGRHLFVKFRSDKHDQRKGFAAKYYFISNSPHMPTPLPVNDSENKNSSHIYQRLPTTFRPRGGRESVGT